MRRVQHLLGRKNSQGMEVYAHVSNKLLGKIQSRLDRMKLNRYSILKDAAGMH